MEVSEAEGRSEVDLESLRSGNGFRDWKDNVGLERSAHPEWFRLYGAGDVGCNWKASGLTWARLADLLVRVVDFVGGIVQWA